MVNDLTLEIFPTVIKWSGANIAINADLEQIINLTPNFSGKASLLFTLDAGTDMTFILEALMPDDTYQEIWSSTRSATGVLVLGVEDLSTVRAAANKVKMRVTTDGSTTGQFMFNLQKI